MVADFELGRSIKSKSKNLQIY